MPLDIRKLHRKGRLSPGQSFGWYWSRDGEPAGNIGVFTGSKSVRLTYAWTPKGHERLDMSYDVQIDRTKCNYGGSRPWFCCPRCVRRCAVLYGIARDGRFGCRRCMRLAYLSEAEDTLGRLWRKQRKLEARLGENGERPKGMRVRTYTRICAKLDDVGQAKDRDFMIGAARLLARLGVNPDEIVE